MIEELQGYIANNFDFLVEKLSAPDGQLATQHKLRALIREIASTTNDAIPTDECFNDVAATATIKKLGQLESMVKLAAASAGLERNQRDTLISQVKRFFSVLMATSLTVSSSTDQNDNFQLESGGVSDEKNPIINDLARELHDTVATDISAAIMILNKLMESNYNVANLTDSLAQVYALLESALSSTRRIMRFIERPRLDSGLSLIDGLKRYGMLIQTLYGIDVSVISKGDETRIDGARRKELYLILKEAMTNAGKHSQASHLKVELTVDSNKVTADVQDNGKGLVEQDLENSRGLKYMRERAQRIGGVVKIFSKPGYGTTVHLELPCR